MGRHCWPSLLERSTAGRGGSPLGSPPPHCKPREQSPHVSVQDDTHRLYQEGGAVHS